MIEREEIARALRENGGMSSAARALGVSRRTLQNRMRDLRMTRSKGGRPRHKLRRRRAAGIGVVGTVAAVAGALLIGRSLGKSDKFNV